jgi:hypothetical protein
VEKSKADLIRDYVRREYVEPARKRGDSSLRIVAGDVQRALRLENRIPLVCSALSGKKFLEQNQLILNRRDGPPSGVSNTVVFTYSLGKEGRGTEQRMSDFLALRGIAKEVFQSLGGGESFLKAERDKFYHR